MLGPVLCGLQIPLQAPLLPKLRGHFAEFLNNASPAGLRILSSSTCVGLRYGFPQNNSGFSRQRLGTLRYLYFAPHHGSCLYRGFASCINTSRLRRTFLFRLALRLLCPHSSVHGKYRNLNLLSIGYALKPRLRSRLTRGRSALPRKPWIFGHEDSHFILATHSGILSSIQSTAPYRYCFIPYAMLLYQSHLCVIPELRCGVSAPDIFGAGPLD